MKTQLLKLSPREFCAATHACAEGREFASRFESMSAVWEACPRADWLVRILNAVGEGNGDLVPDPQIHAAGDAAWAAAWAAGGGYAAADSARVAARAAQCAEFRRVIKNPFA